MNITNLSEETLIQICSYLDKESLNNIGRTSRLFNRITKDRALWEQSFFRSRIELFEGRYKTTYLSYLKDYISYFFEAHHLKTLPDNFNDLFKIKTSIKHQMHMYKNCSNERTSEPLGFFKDIQTYQAYQNCSSETKAFDDTLEEFLHASFRSPETVKFLIEDGVKLCVNCLWYAFTNKASLETI